MHLNENENFVRHSYIPMFISADNQLSTNVRDIILVPHSTEIRYKFLDLVKVVIEQDSDILRKIYPNTPQKIKLNNEVGMDWVRRNYNNYPHIVEPNLSK